MNNNITNHLNRRKFMSLFAGTALAGAIPVYGQKAKAKGEKIGDIIMKIDGDQLNFEFFEAPNDQILLGLKIQGLKGVKYYTIKPDKISKENLASDSFTADGKTYYLKFDDGEILTDYPNTSIEIADSTEATARKGKGKWKKIWNLIKGVFKVIVGAWKEIKALWKEYKEAKDTEELMESQQERFENSNNGIFP